jgi:hypothetical protein
MLKLASLALVAASLAACAPGAVSFAPQTVATEPAPQEPAADTRNAGQVIADILVSQGYTCNVQDTAWECMSAGSQWPVYVSYVPQEDGSTTIWFDSYLERAFAKPCDGFANAITDLAAPTASFTASCDDTSKKFRMNTAVVYGGDLDVMAWVHDHESRRASGAQNLRGIHALSKDAVRAIAQR